jgi:hypothetical protein
MGEAGQIVSNAPEFNRYARLVAIDEVRTIKDSEDRAVGRFRFVYLNSPLESKPIEATVDFHFVEGRWYLNLFDYGCPSDCHRVDVYDGPWKRN